jgi:hypothetical protein
MLSGRCATIARTIFLQFFPLEFFARLMKEIAGLEAKIERVRIKTDKEQKLAIRLNGTSDICWESSKYNYFLKATMDQFRDVVFYDYTKIAARCIDGYRTKRKLEDYRLTFSYSGQNWDDCERALKDGTNVAVAFAVKRGNPLPETHKGHKVIDGDLHDLRFLDIPGVIVGLRYKLPKIIGRKGTLSVLDVPNFVIQ